MTTIVNTPPTQESGNNMSSIIALIVFAGVILLIVYLLLPVLRRGVSTPQVQIPDQIDVNVNTPQQQ